MMGLLAVGLVPPGASLARGRGRWSSLTSGRSGTVDGRAPTAFSTRTRARLRAAGARTGTVVAASEGRPGKDGDSSSSSSPPLRRRLAAAIPLLGTSQVLWSLGGLANAEEAYVVHVVQPNDTLYDISLEYDTTVTALRQANGLMHEGKGRESWNQVLYEGERIRVPVTSDNREFIESRDARKRVAADASHARASPSPTSDAPAAAAPKESSTARSSGFVPSAPKRTSAPSSPSPADGGERERAGAKADAVGSVEPSEWRIPYVHMPRGDVTRLTRAELEMMLPKRKLFAQELIGPDGHVRDADVLVLVETPDCVWCHKMHPAWKKLAGKLAKSNPEIRVCSFTADCPEAKVFVGKHLGATSYPTVIALPRHGGVYKFGGTDRSVDMLTAFAKEAFQNPVAREAEAAIAAAAEATARGAAPKASVAGDTTLITGKDAATKERGGWMERRRKQKQLRESEQRDRNSSSSETAVQNSKSPAWERDGAWGISPSGSGGGPKMSTATAAWTQSASGVAKVAAPFALTGLAIGLFFAGALKLIDAGVGTTEKSADPSRRYSSSTPAGQSTGRSKYWGSDVADSGSADTARARAAAAMATAKSGMSTLAAERERLKAERRREKEANAIPAGASLERLVVWTQMVETEMTTLARRFFFLLGAWFRLQVRLARESLKLARKQLTGAARARKGERFGR